jgi:hypothetical protein
MTFSSVDPNESFEMVICHLWSLGWEKAGSGNDIMKMRHVIISFLRLVFSLVHS